MDKFLDYLSKNYNGTSTLSILGVVFVTLKLCDKIDWSWWWVVAPFWAPLAVVALLLAIYLIMCIITYLCDALIELMTKNK
jgi:energy-coupling factor transporter transmembrane protein EcfT